MTCSWVKSGHPELEIEAGGVQVAQGRDDLLCDRFGRADVEGALGPDVGGERLVGRRPEAAFPGDPDHGIPPLGPELGSSFSSVSATWPGAWMPTARAG